MNATLAAAGPYFHNVPVQSTGGGARPAGGVRGRGRGASDEDGGPADEGGGDERGVEEDIGVFFVLCFATRIKALVLLFL